MPIEKITSLERLAENGFSVPGNRLYLSAEECDPIVPPKDFTHPLRTMHYILRSAHPLEDQFSSGAFSSPHGQGVSADQVQETMQAQYAAMIAAAQPEASLQIRRDLRLKGITDYRPEDMGVYINHWFPYACHLTVHARASAPTRVSFVKVEHGFHSIQSLLDPNADVIAKALPNSKYVDRSALTAFLSEVERARALLGGNQEFEVVCLPEDGRYVFVQAKSYTDPVRRNFEWDEDAFLKGQSHYYSYVYSPQEDSWSADPLLATRMSTEPVDECMPLLIMDEAVWMDEIVRTKNLFLKSSSDVQDAAAVLERTLRHPRRSVQLWNAVRRGYGELMNLAEQHERYMLWDRSVLTHWEGVISPLLPVPHDVQLMREQLAACSSVHVRAMESSPVLTHQSFGTASQRQIGVYLGTGELMPWPGRTVDHAFTLPDELKNGVRMRIMVRPDQRVSFQLA